MITTTNMGAHPGKIVRRAVLGLAALGASVALLSAPAALADPADPADPVPPPAAPTVVPMDSTTGPVTATSSQLTDGMPHLPSPDNLPPGTTDTPPQTRSLGYLRDILHAIRTQDVTMSDALLLLGQRPLSSSAGAGQSSGPSGPVGSSAAMPDAPAAPVPATP